jgi:hypothetical protein
VDDPVLGRAVEDFGVGGRARRFALVGAAGDGIGPQQRLVNHLGAAVVVEVGRLIAGGRRRAGAGEGVRVRAQRHGGAVGEGFGFSVFQFADREDDVRVDGFRHRSAGAVGIDEFGFDRFRLDAAGQRFDRDRARARPLFGAAGIGRRVGRVVGAAAAAEELEAGGEVGVEFRPGRRVDAVVGDFQRVDGLVFVDPAEDLALGRGL